ncbi:Uncharacterised protein [Bordetella pertussis]|nr:Uncharacterised protein [Bordetella pertussis]
MQQPFGGLAHAGQPGQQQAGRPRLCLGILGAQRRDQLARRQHAGNAAYALAGAPDVLPGLGPRRAEVGRGRLGSRQVGRVQAGGHDAGFQVVAGNAGEKRRVQHVGRARVDDGLLVGLGGIGLGGRDEARTHIGEVGPRGERRQDALARGDCAGQYQRPIVEAPYFGDQRERAERAGVAARAGAHQDQAVDAGLQGLLGVAHGRDVVEDLAAPGMHAGNQVAGRAQAGDDVGHPVAGAHVQVVFEPVVRLVDDLVDRVGRHDAVRMRAAVFGQAGLDFVEPVAQQRLGARIERGKRPHDAADALRDRQLGVGDDKHGRADHGQGHAGVQLGNHGMGHGGVSCVHVGRFQLLSAGVICAYNYLPVVR